MRGAAYTMKRSIHSPHGRISSIVSRLPEEFVEDDALISYSGRGANPNPNLDYGNGIDWGNLPVSYLQRGASINAKGCE